MHVVFTAVPGHGHVYPMVPLASRLAERGHKVTFVTGAEMGARVEQLGFPCVTAGPSLERMQANALADATVRASLEHAPWKVAAAIFAKRAALVLEDLDRVDLTPHLVVHDTYELGGPLLAARSGVPWVSHGLGPRWPSYLEEHLDSHLAGVWADQSADVPPRGGIGHHAYIEICPPAVRPDDSIATDTTIESRSEPLAEPPDPAAACRTSPRPRIYSTLGTFSNANPRPFRTLLDAFAGIDADVVMTTGGRLEAGALGPVPTNVRVEPYLPQAQVLAQCNLVVCHGGSGTMLAALGRGIPVVIVPQGADQFRNAPFWQRSGAARVLPTDEVSSASISDALARSAPGESLHVAAVATADAIAAMPSVDETAARLEALVT